LVDDSDDEVEELAGREEAEAEEEVVFAQAQVEVFVRREDQILEGFVGKGRVVLAGHVADDLALGDEREKRHQAEEDSSLVVVRNLGAIEDHE